MDFELTYATMFNPPEELHVRYEQALKHVTSNLGKEIPMLVNNEDIYAEEKTEVRSPINHDWLLAVVQKGTDDQAQKAVRAAKDAFASWSRTHWIKRVEMIRKATAIMQERLFESATAMTLDVGKSRMEALGDVQETIDLLKYACDQMEINDGYVSEMGKDPLIGYQASNISRLRPYGVWLVISPFNFPFALTGGPVGAALVTGNTVVIKPASDSAWTVSHFVDCFRDAGFPDGVVNFVTGAGSTIGKALVSCDVDGITFTGSAYTGAQIYRTVSSCNWIRPTILELGGKNAVIVSKNADLDQASLGIVRSAFGLQGQKCSAASRVYIEPPVYDDLVERLFIATKNLIIGDPSERTTYLGPVINKTAYQDFQVYVAEIKESGGNILTGGDVRQEGVFIKGFFCEPTLVTDLPYESRLWRHEMFLPITTVAKVDNLNEAMQKANDVNYGLTAGFYGANEETPWFFDNIEAGVVYVNRPHGATTGAWPGYQPFGGWKASGSSGKNAGGKYYLPLYMHEQIQTTIW